MAGYSQKTLAEKLGIKPGFHIAIICDPPDYKKTLGKLDASVTVDSRLKGDYDFIHFFTKSRAEYQTRFHNLKQHLKQKGMIWISWPKKASKIATDLDENIIREYALENGLVDVKVCAVDETWSGLKLVIRLKDRT